MKKRTVALLLTMAVSLSSLIGCASDSNESTGGASAKTETSAETQTAASSEAETEKGPLPDDYFAGTELDIAVYRINGDNTESFNDKEIIKMVTEATGIKVNWIEIPKSGKEEQIANILSSGDMPDVMLGLLSSTDVASNMELFYDLSEEGLLETYAPNVVSDYEEGGQNVFYYLTAPDGSIRSLAGNQGLSRSSDASAGWLINQVWLDKLGLKTPETADDLYDVLCAFRDNDANGNGDASDEIPLSFCGMDGNYGFLNLANAFGIANTGNSASNYYFMLDEQDKVVSVLDTDNFRAFLEWAHMLKEEKLLDVEGFSQTTEQYKAKGAADRLGLVMAYNTSQAGSTDEIMSNLIPVQALEDVPARKTGAEGKPSFNITSFVVAADSEKVEAALHWWNWLSGDKERFYLARFGQYYINEDGQYVGDMDPAKKEEGVTYPGVWTLGMGNVQSPYGGPVDYDDIFDETNFRYAYREELADRGMMMSAAQHMKIASRITAPEKIQERTFIETDLVAMVNGYIATSVVEGVTDASWTKFLEDLKIYRYYDWLDWWQGYVNRDF